MSPIATQNATSRSTMTGADAGQSDVTPVLVIDRFDHWHNQDCALLSPTSITWSDPCTIAGRVA